MPGLYIFNPQNGIRLMTDEKNIHHNSICQNRPTSTRVSSQLKPWGNGRRRKLGANSPSAPDVVLVTLYRVSRHLRDTPRPHTIHIQSLIGRHNNPVKDDYSSAVILCDMCLSQWEDCHMMRIPVHKHTASSREPRPTWLYLRTNRPSSSLSDYSRNSGCSVTSFTFTPSTFPHVLSRVNVLEGTRFTKPDAAFSEPAHFTADAFLLLRREKGSLSVRVEAPEETNWMWNI